MGLQVKGPAAGHWSHYPTSAPSAKVNWLKQVMQEKAVVSFSVSVCAFDGVYSTSTWLYVPKNKYILNIFIYFWDIWNCSIATGSGSVCWCPPSYMMYLVVLVEERRTVPAIHNNPRIDTLSNYSKTASADSTHYISKWIRMKLQSTPMAIGFLLFLQQQYFHSLSELIQKSNISILPQAKRQQW